MVGDYLVFIPCSLNLAETNSNDKTIFRFSAWHGKADPGVPQVNQPRLRRSHVVKGHFVKIVRYS